MVVIGIALVTLLALVSGANLLLTAGVVQRLRDHTERIGELSGVPPMVSLQPPGGQISDFSARSTQGVEITRAGLSGIVLFGAFAEGCPMCRQALPGFLELARTIPGGRDQVLVLLAGRHDAMSRERRQLEPVAQVVESEARAEMADALGLQGFPAVGLVNFDTGTVLVAGTRADQVKRFLAPKVAQ